MPGVNVETWVRVLQPERAASFALDQARQWERGSREVPVEVLGQVPWQSLPWCSLSFRKGRLEEKGRVTFDPRTKRQGPFIDD